MKLYIKSKSFSFKLVQPLQTSKGLITHKNGWLIHIEDSYGNSGWGEVSSFKTSALNLYRNIIAQLDEKIDRKYLEELIEKYQGPLGFGLGGALIELDNSFNPKLFQNWPKANNSAFLLPTNKCPVKTIKYILGKHSDRRKTFSFKWKVANQNNIKERELLENILGILPENSRLRIDANGGWDRTIANEWATSLCTESRLEWLEQPLAANDIEGLYALAKYIPIALDESLKAKPSLRNEWKSWQVRRPSLDGDPKLLLNELNKGINNLVISTAFETGIGQRWVSHLAVLQQQGPTPIAPGLAPGWCPRGRLFSENPNLVWNAA